MDVLVPLLLWASIQLAASMSPGPAFILSVKTAMSYGRRPAIFTAIGLAIGVGFHVVIALTGMSLILSKSVIAYNIIKYAGAAYLIYIGINSLIKSYRAFKEKKDEQSSKALFVEGDIHSRQEISISKAFVQGLVTNVLNPKALVFFTAVLSQFLGADMTVSTKIFYGLISVGIEGVWFTFVAVVLTHPAIRQKFIKFIHWIDGVFGGLIVYLGVKIASLTG